MTHPYITHSKRICQSVVQNYWRAICLMLKVYSSNFIKVLCIIVPAISCLLIGNIYDVRSLISSFEYRDLLWLLWLFLVPYLVMPFMLTAKCLRLEDQLNDKKEKRELKLELKKKLEILRHDNRSPVSSQLNYFDFVKECAVLMHNSGVTSSLIERYEDKAINALTMNSREECLLEIIYSLAEQEQKGE